MTAAAAHLPRRFLLVAALPSPADRWQRPDAARARRFSAATAVVLMGSVLVHGAFVATALLPDRRPQVSAPEEIPVEIVREQPPEPSKPELSKTEAPAEAPAASKAEVPPEQPKPTPEAKVEEPPPEAPKPEPAKPEPAKGERAKLEAPARPEQPAPEPAAQPAPDPDAAAELKSLQDELAALKAENAAIQAGGPAPGTPAPVGLRGLGPLPESFQAAALPSETEGEGDVVGYAAVVFSRLAKAKELGARLGEPGSAGVQFAVDERGGLAFVKLAASSGVKALDDEAIAIVRKAAPFPVPPEGAQRSFAANVNFVGAAP